MTDIYDRLPPFLDVEQLAAALERVAAGDTVVDPALASLPATPADNRRVRAVLAYLRSN